MCTHLMEVFNAWAINVKNNDILVFKLFILVCKWLRYLSFPFKKNCHYQDWNRTWYTGNPDFTQCFQNTVLVWIPCLYLWTCGPIYMLYLHSHSHGYICMNHFNKAKTVSTFSIPVIFPVILFMKFCCSQLEHCCITSSFNLTMVNAKAGVITHTMVTCQPANWPRWPIQFLLGILYNFFIYIYYVCLCFSTLSEPTPLAYVPDQQSEGYPHMSLVLLEILFHNTRSMSHYGMHAPVSLIRSIYLRGGQPAAPELHVALCPFSCGFMHENGQRAEATWKHIEV